MLTTSVIIPTYHRPVELANCIESLLKQTRPPHEIIVVDDGQLETLPWQKECEAAGIPLLYHKKTSPGLTASRNVGIGMASKEILFFLDDDVVLYPDYLEKILDCFRDNPEAAGVSGWIANNKPVGVAGRLRLIWDLLFLNSWVREGVVLPSGFCVDYGSTGFMPRRVRPVEFLPGGVCAWRREIFSSFSFNEGYVGYGLGEDKDFSYRVSRHHLLLLEPRARLDHFESPKMRYDRRNRGREFVLSRYRFFHDYLDHGLFNRLCFAWAVLGYALARLAVFLSWPRRTRLDHFLGVMDAVRELLAPPKGNVP